MTIEVTPGVFWDTETQQQSQDAIDWINETVRPNLSEPTLDKYNRPDERYYENDTVIVTQKQVYIKEGHDWARKGVQYFVESKSDQ